MLRTSLGRLRLIQGCSAKFISFAFKIFVMQLHHFFSELKDSRVVGRVRYKYSDILFLIVLALLSNAGSYRQIAQFISAHYASLSVLLDLRWSRMPAYTTIRDIMLRVDYEQLESIFRHHSSYLLGEIAGYDASCCQHICFDGKTIRRSDLSEQNQGLIQFLNGYMVETGLIICHAVVSDKTNEIPIFQQLLGELGLHSSLLSLDAMHCQKKLSPKPLPPTTI